ncbi:hypothetical protein DFJ58DRAFT_610154, partial [Suillus subalutaceus]|uniref:uncharacterized protein n=1 Tax=Suillus subalutaceus TaxID=48586 RepID=UPI001B873BE0
LAIELLTKDNEDTPTNLAFLSARRLPHGGVLYELDSVESVLWFNVPAHRSKFLEHFGTEIVIKDRSFHVLVENVPISFIPDNHAAIADVEKKAGLKHKSIYRARYIKLAARRNPGQRTAHVILTFGTKEGANQAIKHGLSIEGKKEHDTCGTCSNQHRMATCTITDQTQYQCKNCDVAGHAAWSCDCPMFISKWESYKNRNVDAKYRFFLTEDPLTWE